MTLRSYDIVGDEFKVGYRRQDAWSWKIAIAFFFGDVGAGTFFVCVFFDYMPGLVLGWALATFFKPAALFMHLGRPERFWRAITNVGSAWISRGVLGAGIFGAFGLLHMANIHYGMLGPLLSTFVFVMSIVGCFIVMIYLGYVLSHSPAIPLWNTGLMPFISLVYGLMGGVTIAILLGVNSFLIANPAALQFLKISEVVLIAITLVMILSLLHGAAYQNSTGMATVLQLLYGQYAKWFLGYVIFIGLIASGILALTGSMAIFVLLLVAVMTLVGDLGLKIMLFKSALYSPPLSHSTL